MSAPYPQQSNADGRRGSFELREILALVAAGAGAVGYLLGFFDDGVGALMGSMAGFGLIASAALAGLRFAPKTPDALFVAVPLSAYAALALLQDVIRNTASGLVSILMVLALAQLGSVLAVLLIEGGVIKSGSPGPASGPHQQGQRFPQGQPGPRGPGGPGGPGGARPGPGWSPQGQAAPGAKFGGPPPWNPASGGQPALQPPAPQSPPGGWNPSSDGFSAVNPDGPRPASQSGPLQQPGQAQQQHNPQSGQQQSGQQQHSGAQQSGQPQQSGAQPHSGQPQQPTAQGAPQPQSGQPSRQQPNSDQDKSGGPQGTRQMPHPGTNPPTF